MNEVYKCARKHDKAQKLSSGSHGRDVLPKSTTAQTQRSLSTSSTGYKTQRALSTKILKFGAQLEKVKAISAESTIAAVNLSKIPRAMLIIYSAKI